MCGNICPRESKTRLEIQDLSRLNSKTMERKREKLYILSNKFSGISVQSYICQTFIFLIFLFINLYSVSFFAVQQHVAILCAQIQLGGLKIHSSNQSWHWWDDSRGDSQWRISTHFPGVWERTNPGAAGQVRRPLPPQLPKDIGRRKWPEGFVVLVVLYSECPKLLEMWLAVSRNWGSLRQHAFPLIPVLPRTEVCVQEASVRWL